ncbi:hypothetical protein [Aporhodopirellula aestuarii]|uniref:Uncharacterized protein n=1 Tax=Aporhodopirellula aestuarii TaxID=2950107 RepID=A0ABT0UA18_9BACT|nr:hypothetical protein [Aporhodopirellula aestuarii]MCM2373726.1 hypothetical protein [Aporhodopirellula aestuarii]
MVSRDIDDIQKPLTRVRGLGKQSEASRNATTLNTVVRTNEPPGAAPVIASRLGLGGGDVDPGLASGAFAYRRYRD